MARWTNWDSTLQAEPAEIARPKTVDQVVDLVRRAKSSGKTVRPFGSGHSWSPLVPCNDIILDTSFLNRAEHIDQQAKVARLQAGTKLKDIGPLLEKFGLAMTNLGAITAQSICGAISTGTHGTGLNYGCIGTQVSAAELVDGNGAVRTFNLDDHPKEMKALRLSLGALGIITSLTLELTELHNVQLEGKRMKFDAILSDLESIVANERVRLYWFPGSDEAYVNIMNRTELPDDEGPVYSWVDAELLRRRLMGILWDAGKSWPSFVDELNWFQERVGYASTKVVGPVYEAITTPMPPFHQECEVAVPMCSAAAALQAFDKLVQDEKMMANVPSEIRFVAGDDLYISPCNRGPVCYIGAYSSGQHDQKRFMTRFMEVMAPFGGRPHWGKIGAPTRDFARSIYPKWDEFCQVRADLDPFGVFLNPYLQSLFSD